MFDGNGQKNYALKWLVANGEIISISLAIIMAAISYIYCNAVFPECEDDFIFIIIFLCCAVIASLIGHKRPGISIILSFFSVVVSNDAFDSLSMNAGMTKVLPIIAVLSFVIVFVILSTLDLTDVNNLTIINFFKQNNLEDEEYTLRRGAVISALMLILLIPTTSMITGIYSSVGLYVLVPIVLIIGLIVLEKVQNRTFIMRGKIGSILKMADERTDPIEKAIIQNYCAELLINDVNKRIAPMIKRLNKKIRKNHSPQEKHKLEALSRERDEILARAKPLKYSGDRGAPSAAKSTFRELVDSFASLATCDKHEYIIGERSNDEGGRSPFDRLYKSKDVSFDYGIFCLLSSKYKIPVLQSKGGNRYWLYPGFIVYGKDLKHFRILNWYDVDIDFFLTKHALQKGVKDSEIIEKTYRHANKDGSADLRYGENYAVYLAKYGEFTLYPFGDTYIFSNYDAPSRFCTAFSEYTYAHVMNRNDNK